jgi:hypothetical protein
MGTTKSKEATTTQVLAENGVVNSKFQDALESHRSPWSTPVVENKREKGSHRAKGYLSSRVSWPSLVAGPLGGDAANFVLLRRTTAN